MSFAILFYILPIYTLLHIIKKYRKPIIFMCTQNKCIRLIDWIEGERDSVRVRRACLWLHARKPRPALPPPGRRHASSNIDRPLSLHLHTLLILILPLPSYTTYTAYYVITSPLTLLSSYHWQTRLGTRHSYHPRFTTKWRIYTKDNMNWGWGGWRP